MYNQSYNYGIKSNNNRFVGGGFLGPFILGGITGGLLAPSFQRPVYSPVPVPVYPVPQPMPVPVYQNTQIYY